MDWVEEQRLKEVEDLVHYMWTIFDPKGKGWSVILPRTTYSQLKSRIKKLDLN